MADKTWKEKIGKRLMKHVAETTQGKTLREVKRNIESQRDSGILCHECEAIARKLGI